MSGFEVVGVVIGVLPILMRASKVALRMVDVTASMQRFHEKFYWEAFVIHRDLRAFTDSLPLTVGVKMQLKVASITALWESDESVKKVIFERLGEEGSEEFIVLTHKVLSALNRLINNHESLRGHLAVSSQPMYSRALQILNDPSFGIKKSNLIKRIKFIMEKESRQSDMGDLRFWSNHLTAFLSCNPAERKDPLAPNERMLPENYDAIASSEETLAVNDVGLVVAVEFGLEFTAIAFATPSGDAIDLDGIYQLTDWGPHFQNSYKIPTQISYSADGECLCLRNESPQDFFYNGISVFNSVYYPGSFSGIKLPPGKSITDLPRDFLKMIFECFTSALDHMYSSVLDMIPIDFILTIPQKQDVGANGRSALLRIMIETGFLRQFPRLRDIFIVPELDAAGLFTAMEFEKLGLTSFQKLDGVFVCILGVDAQFASYTVAETRPLSFERITSMNGGNYGSAAIDEAFKEWILLALGQENMIQEQSDAWRKIMREFRQIRMAFDGQRSDLYFELPEPLEMLSRRENISEGEVRISIAEMKSFFAPVEQNIRAAIESHLYEAATMDCEIKTMVVMGSFSESPYLRKCLRDAASAQGIQVLSSEHGWVSSVRGAVVHGATKKTRGFESVKLVPHSWGLRLDSTMSCPAFPMSNQGQVVWQLWKDDLVLSRYRPRYTVGEIAWKLEDLNKRHFSLKITQSAEKEAQVSETGANGFVDIATLRWSLDDDAKVLKKKMKEFEAKELNPKTKFWQSRKTSWIVPCVCEMIFDSKVLTVRLKLHGQILAQKRIEMSNS